MNKKFQLLLTTTLTITETVVSSIRFNIFFSASFCRITSMIEQIVNTPSTDKIENIIKFPNGSKYAPFTFKTVPHSHFLIVSELA